MSSSNSPCAACKCLRRKCTQECVFAPYFPPDQPQKFINVHKVFGASNVAKLLNDINAAQRDDAVNSLAYEAEYRLRDPIYGCVGLISLLQTKLKQIQHDLYNAKKELSTYIGPAAMLPILQSSYMQQHPNNPSSSALLPHNMQPMMGFPPGMAAAHGGAQLVIRDPQQHQQQQPHPHQQQHQRQHPHPHQQQHQHQQMFEAQQMAAAAREQQEMLRSYEQQHQQQPAQQQELLSFNFGFDTAAPATANHTFNQMPAAGAGASGIVPSLSLSSFENAAYHHQMQQHHQQPSEHHHPQPHQLQFQSQIILQQQLQQQQQATPQQPQRAQSDEGRCNIGPSC